MKESSYPFDEIKAISWVREVKNVLYCSKVMYVFMNPKGSSLVFSLIILSLILISALSVAAVAVTDRRSVYSSDKSNLAFQAADSGVEIVLQKIYKTNQDNLDDLARAIDGDPHPRCVDDGSSAASITLDAAQGTAQVSFFQGDGDVAYADCSGADWRSKVSKIKSSGSYRGTIRAVEVGVIPKMVCPDGICNGSETHISCSADCP